MLYPPVCPTLSTFKWALPPKKNHTTTKLPPHHLHNPSLSNTTPHTKTCPSNMPSRIKLSMKSPTSSATTEMTGMNSAPRQPISQGRPRKLPAHPNNHQNTKLPETKESLLPNRSYKKIHTASYSSPSTMLTSGRYTRKPKLPSGRQKRSTFRQTSQTGSGVEGKQTL